MGQPQAVITWICNVSRKEKHLSKFITVSMFFLLENAMLIARIFTLLKGARNPLLTFCDIKVSNASFALSHPRRRRRRRTISELKQGNYLLNSRLVVEEIILEAQHEIA